MAEPKSVTPVLVEKRPACQDVPSWFNIWVYLLLLAGLWFRLAYLMAGYFHVDEFITMLASQMVANRGAPILPSGLFYDHGLLQSYLTGMLVFVSGFREEIARWPSVLVSVLTIAVYYTVARRLFDSRLTGLLAAALVTFDALSITWGSRARMYSLAHLFVLLALAWLLEGFFKRPASRTRYLFLACLAAAVLSHMVTALILPVLVVLAAVFSLVYRRDWLRARGLCWEALLGLALLACAAIVAIMGHLSSTSSAGGGGGSLLGGFLSPGFEWSRFDNFVGFYQSSPYTWLLPVIGAGLAWTLYRLLRRRATFPDVAFVFLVSFVVLVILEVGGLAAEEWHNSRYSFILNLPAFFLLGAESLSRLLRIVVGLVSRLDLRIRAGYRLPVAAGLAGLVIVAAAWGPAAWRRAHASSSGGYNTAFAYVGDNWQDGDRLMTFHPAAAYLYLQRCDYYANQVTAKVLDVDAGEGETALVDRYVGSPLIDSVDRLNALLADRPVWFVVDSGRLFARYQPFFTQQVLAQMDLRQQTGDVAIFHSRPYPIALPEKPPTSLDATFGELINLGGYSLDPTSIAPDGTLSLGLYWRPVGTPTRQLKVFVQLRNGQSLTIAQADHYIYEGLLTVEEWRRLQDGGEWLRDTADLLLPLPLSPGEGPYSIYVGLYDPATMERLPLLNDASGENAVVIELGE